MKNLNKGEHVSKNSLGKQVPCKSVFSVDSFWHSYASIGR